MKTCAEKLIKQHPDLTHTKNMKVTSHVQRPANGWILNTLVIENCDAPFRFKRKSHYKNLENQYVNMTYYPVQEKLAGLDFEYMKVVRIKRS